MSVRSEMAADVLSAMANKNRLMILCHLLNEELTVSELSERVGLNQSPMSQHLSKLRGRNLVTTRREGQSIRYRLASREVEAILTTLYTVYCGDPATVVDTNSYTL